eukprot:gene14827-20880_t
MEDPSQKMHQYLERKQRRQEEFWLRRYGKVLYPVLPKPSSMHSEDTLNSTEGRLPPIRSGQGNPALFQAAGPIKSFPMKGADINPDRKHKQVNMPYHPSGQTTFLPPISHSAKISSHPQSSGMPLSPNQIPAHHLSSEPVELPQPSQQLSPQTSHQEAATHSPIPSHLLEIDEPQPSSPGAHNSPSAYKGHYSPGAHTHPRQSAKVPMQMPGGLHMQHNDGPVKLPPLTQPDSPSLMHTVDISPKTEPRPKKVIRDVQMETNVLKSIKAREDVLDRLRIAGDKLSTVFGDATPLVLSQADPLVRLFYRLVGNLRGRTLDTVEVIAAWKRKTNSPEPFVYYGKDYLATVGPDLAFLDQLSFLRSRLQQKKAADDPFLVEVTPDGIPIEEATTCDLRRAGHRLSSDALRIRMARRAMAAYFGHGDPDRPASASSSLGSPEDLASLLIPKPAPLLQLEGQLLREALIPMVHSVIIQIHAHLAAESEIRESTRDLARRVTSTLCHEEDLSDLQVMLSSSDTSLPLKVMEVMHSMNIKVPPAPPSASSLQPASSMTAALAEVEAEGIVEEEGAAGEPGDEKEMFAEESHADVFVVDHDAMQQSLLSGIEDLIDEDDGLFIDFAVGAMVASLEDPYVEHIAEGSFTVDGWEIDRQLDSLIAGLEASSSGRDAGEDIFNSAPQFHLRMNPQLTGGLEVRGASPLFAPTSSTKPAAVSTTSRKPPPTGLAGVDENRTLGGCTHQEMGVQ